MYLTSAKTKIFLSILFLTILPEKTCVLLNLILIFLICLHNLTKFYTIYCHVLRVQMFENMIVKLNGRSIQQVLRQNLRWLLS